MISIGLGVLSAGMSLFGGMSAKKDAEEAARLQREMGKMNASYIREEGAENLKRTQYGMERKEGLTRALSAASGLGGRTPGEYLNSMREVHQGELDWMRKSTDQRARMAKKSGMYQADMTSAQGSAAMWSGMGSAFGSMSRLFT